MNNESTSVNAGGRWRRATLVSAFAAALSVAFVACGDDDTNGAATTPDAGESLTTPSLPAEGESLVPGESPADDGQARLPSNAEEYAAATFAAWLRGDGDALDEMASADVVALLEENPPADRPSAEGWTMAGCDAATGQVACQFESASGETLTLVVDNAAAANSEPAAVREAMFS